MSRAKIETAFLGCYTVAALDASTQNAAGWLIKALCAWILRDELPADIPADLAPVWAVIRTESETLHAMRKEAEDARTDAAKKAAAARWNADASKRNANECERIPTQCDAMRSDAIKETETEKRKEKGNNIRNESESERAGKPASASASASASGKIDLDFFDWYVRPDKELVPAALELIGEQGNARMRGRLGKAKRLLGVGAFREELATFAAELRAGEVPANKGATLNARLSAREACS
jgi:hypothetical protein